MRRSPLMTHCTRSTRCQFYLAQGAIVRSAGIALHTAAATRTIGHEETGARCTGLRAVEPPWSVSPLALARLAPGGPPPNVVQPCGAGASGSQLRRPRHPLLRSW